MVIGAPPACAARPPKTTRNMSDCVGKIISSEASEATFAGSDSLLHGVKKIIGFFFECDYKILENQKT